MKRDQINIAEKIVRILSEASATLDIDHIYREIKKDTPTDIDEIFHISYILEEQKIVKITTENNSAPYFNIVSVSITSIGYEAASKGYSQWLQEQRELKHIDQQTKIQTYNNLKINRITAVLALIISAASFSYTIFKNEIDEFLLGEEPEGRKEEEVIKENHKIDMEIFKNDVYRSQEYPLENPRINSFDINYDTLKVSLPKVKLGQKDSI